MATALPLPSVDIASRDPKEPATTNINSSTSINTSINSVPPLPLSVRDELLSYLLPPRPPLPPHLLSRAFLTRLTFLPPADDDLDAHLSPAPMAKNALNPNALHAALLALSPADIRETEYAHDGEHTVARTMLGDAVEARFEHDDRGWVYAGASLGPSGAWDWKRNVEDVRPYAAHGFNNDSYGNGYGYDGGDAPDDYWAGFTPPQRAAQLPDDDEGDDHYWAQYAGGGAHEESAGGNYGYETDTKDAKDMNEKEMEGSEKEEADADAEPVTPPSALVDPGPAALSALISGLGVSGVSGSGASQPSSVLSQKIAAKVRAQLMRAWTSFSADQDAESAAYAWLRLAREIADRPSWVEGGEMLGDAREAVVRARVEAAKDVHDVLEEEGFFRLCEEAIRRNPPAEEQEFEYES